MSTKGGAIQYRMYSPEDRDGVRHLLMRTFGNCMGFDRYEDGNPLGDPIRVVAEIDGAVVGFNHWIPWRIPTPSGGYVVFQSGASAVGTEARGKGVFASLLAAGEDAARERGVSAFFGCPNPASFSSFVRAGWSHIATIRLTAVLRPALRRERHTSRIPRGGANEFADWRYQHAGIEYTVVPNQRYGPLAAYFREGSAFGVPVLKLVDVLDDEGRRHADVVGAVAGALPGPGIVLLRATDHPAIRRSVAVAIPRAWNTPVIVKPISANASELRLLEGTLLLYGDIDAA